MSEWRKPTKCAVEGCEVIFTPSDPRMTFCQQHHLAVIGMIMQNLSKGLAPEDAVASVIGVPKSQQN